MPAGLHLPIRRTGWTAVDDIAVVAKDASELLCDVRPAVSTAGTGWRRFHGLPVVLCGVHGLWGCVLGRVALRRVADGTDPCRPRSRRPTLPPIRRDTRPGIIEPRGANANKGRRPFTLSARLRTEKAPHYAREKRSYRSKRAVSKSIDKSYQSQFSRVGRQSALKQDIDPLGDGSKAVISGAKYDFTSCSRLAAGDKVHRYKIPLSLTDFRAGM